MRSATVADAGELAALLGEAFCDDPVCRWALGSPAAMTVVFEALARHVYLGHGCCVWAPGGGAMLSARPGLHRTLPWRSQLRLAGPLLLHGGPRRVLRTARFEGVLARRRPAAAHLYLFAVGVVPAARGQGLAAALLGEALAEADHERWPAYLENSNPANEPLYRRLGFEARETFRPAPGSPPITTMWREPHIPLAANPTRG